MSVLRAALARARGVTLRCRASPGEDCGATGALGLVGCWTPAVVDGRCCSECHRGGGFLVKIKILMVILLGLGAFAVWRKVQADRAELDLWNEATAADEG